MSTALPEIISGDDLSLLWAEAFLRTMAPGATATPLLLSLGGMVDNAPKETASIRAAVDQALIATRKMTCKITANTIFPYERWQRNRAAPRDQLYEWYLHRFLPRAKARNPANRYGTYFERMICSTGTQRNGNRLDQRIVNQLEHVLSLWTRATHGNRRPRRSALQLACFDPSKDHTGQSVRGFPCLQQVSLSYGSSDGISISAYYPTQYIFDRAYGNYLGLCHLGEFVAKSLGLELTRLNCFILQPELGKATKTELRPLERTVRAVLNRPKQ